MSLELISQRIFRRRKIRRWSMERLAKESGVSPYTILRVERGEEAQYSTLRKIAKALDLSMPVLVNEDMALGEEYQYEYVREVTPVVVGDDKFGRGFTRMMTLEKLPSGLFHVVKWEIDGKTSWRYHKEEGEELVYCIENAMSVHLGKKYGDSNPIEIPLEEGQCVCFWGSQYHRYVNRGDKPAIALVVWSGRSNLKDSIEIESV